MLNINKITFNNFPVGSKVQGCCHFAENEDILRIVIANLIGLMRPPPTRNKSLRGTEKKI